MSLFILEIGTEELPARFQKGLEKDLITRLSSFLKESNVEFDKVESHVTPRRAAVMVYDIAGVQKESEEVVPGPPVRIAYDADGNPTKAAAGFAKTQGVDLADAFRLETDKGEYLAVRKKMGGAKTADLLATFCPTLIAQLPFAKKMKWGEQEFTFARPVRWVLAMLDDAVVPFEVAELNSGRETYGHRVHAAGPFAIANAADYYSTIEEKCAVVLSAEKRRAKIIEEGNALAEKAGGRIIWKDSLLDEVQGLVEHPIACLGDFDASFLELPRQALLTSMQSHQKSFGVEDAEGNLLPHFLTVLNTTPNEMEVVKVGWERVLRARLEDGRFFWNTDLKADVDTWLAKLDNVIFLAPLGSMGNKTRRISGLCADLAAKVAPEITADAERAGRICKADLVAEMVGEFDSLQGIMGGIYAARKGESDVVAKAIAEQYLPAGPDSPVPSTMGGALVSMADKADTLAGCFGLGMIPTGAADPYALRRCCLGIARIIIEKHLRISAAELFASAQNRYEGITWKLDEQEALTKLNEFFAQRLKNYFTSKGYETLLVEAVLGADSDDVWAADARLKALSAYSKGEGFNQAVLTFKRAANIIRKQGSEAGVELSGAYDAALFENDAEKAFAKALEDVAPKFAQLWAEEDFDALFALLAELRPAVDAFFDNVMVMCDDQKVRANRLNLLSALVQQLGRLADFSALQM